MFDLVSGKLERPLRDKHRGAAITSIAAHTIALGTIGGVLMLATGVIPKVQRAPMMAFVVNEPPPIPPPPRPTPEKAKSTSTTARAVVHRASQGVSVTPIEAVPTVAPVGVAPEREGAVATGGEGHGEGAGSEDVAATMGILGGLEGVPPAPPAFPPTPPKPVRIGGQIAPPALITRVEPIYPPFAITAHLEGVVILEATVDEAGVVQSVTVLRGQPLLNDAAIEALKHWRYSPVLVDGQAVPFTLTVTISFRLSHKPS